MSNTLTNKVSGRMSSRSWAIAIGAAAVVLAAILLIVYLDRYRARVGGRNAPTPVLVANRLIPAGTPGTLVASQTMYAPTTLPRKEVEVGAIADPQYLSGRAAAIDIFPGQQFTATDFAAIPTRPSSRRSPGPARALDLDRQRARQPRAGGRGRLRRHLHRRCRRQPCKLFRPNVKVLAVPTPGGGTSCCASTRRTRPTSRSRPTTRSSGSSSALSSAPSRPHATPQPQLRC